jgi:hypothetical protein
VEAEAQFWVVERPVIKVVAQVVRMVAAVVADGAETTVVAAAVAVASPLRILLV